MTHVHLCVESTTGNNRKRDNENTGCTINKCRSNIPKSSTSSESVQLVVLYYIHMHIVLAMSTSFYGPVVGRVHGQRDGTPGRSTIIITVY